jgi:SAM-dependent methyltransferase
MTQNDQPHWTQQESDIYRALAQVAVPARNEQIAALLTLMPFGAEDQFHIVELASGEGRMSHAVLDAFPHATLLALDYETSMQQETARRIAAFDGRGSVGGFDMLRDDWYGLLDGADVVVSSLCIHHLDGAGKQQLFNAVQRHLSPRGAFLIADLVMPVGPQVRELFAATWDRIAEDASLDLTGSHEVFEQFESERWNYYRFPDDFDKPSPLADQLLWLRQAGFAQVDAFWMQAGHAIYGGYQSQAGAHSLPYDHAHAAALRALTETPL